MIKWIALVVLTFFLHTNIVGQLSESAEVSIITCRQGDDLYNTFGHTAIRIKDTDKRIDILYNYGLFDFKEPNFYSKFLRGKLLYHLGRENIDRFLRNYAYQKRSVFEQKLDISIDDKNNIYKALNENLRPENRSYLYDFFFDNCSTRIKDLLQDNISGITFSESPIEDYTFRDMLDHHKKDKPWSDFGIDLIIGAIADRQATAHQQSFLPEYLYSIFDKASVYHKPLVSESSIILDFEKEHKKRSSSQLPLPLIIAQMLLFLEVLLFIKLKINYNNIWLKAYDNLWILLLGIGGLLLCFMWWGTDHSSTKVNYNLLWINPLFLWLLIYKKRLYIVILAFLCLVGLILGFTLQQFHIVSIVLLLVTIIKLFRIDRSTTSQAS